MNLLIRLLINAAGLWAAAQLIDKMTLTGSWVGILIVALIFGLVNAVIRPILTFFSLPALILTMGLFTVVINAILLQITDLFSSNLDVDGFVPSILGALVISAVSWLLSSLLGDKSERQEKRR